MMNGDANRVIRQRATLLCAGLISQLSVWTYGAESEAQVAVSSVPSIPEGLNKKYSLFTKPSQSVAVDYSYEVDAPQLKAREWLVFAAKPINTPGQRILDVTCSPVSKMIADQSPLQRPVFLSRVPVAGEQHSSDIKFTMQLKATLFSRMLMKKSGRSNDVKLTTKEQSLFLRNSPFFDYTSPVIQKWIKKHQLHRKSREGEVDLARRIFQQIVKQSTYEYLGNQNRKASHVCVSGKSDCGGLSILFVSALRSQGVPARILVGRWAISAKAGEKVGEIVYTQQHVKAEFFAQGVGWIPADLASAVIHDKSPDRLNYFGKDHGDFITMHYDTGMALDTIHFGVSTLDFLQRPAHWATGTGNFKGSSIKESWNVTKQ